MPEVNAVGDLVLTTPEEFRALADPLAIALTDRLRRSVPATTADLAEQLDESASNIERKLEELEKVGVVTSADDAGELSPTACSSRFPRAGSSKRRRARSRT